MIYTALLVGAGLASQSAAACTRATLEEAAAAYIKAQSGGQPSLVSLSANVTYIENDRPTDIKAGVLSQPVTIDLARSIYDEVQCSTFTEISSATNKHPYVISTRLLLTDGKVTTVHSVIADEGDWIFNGTSHLSWAKSETWDIIPEAKRDSRAVIQAAGDAYLDSWENGNVSVPYGTPCARLEGGLYTGERNLTSNSCRMPEFPKPFKGITNRRYVIDQALGAVAIFNDFPFIDTGFPDGVPSMNFVRVEGGMIRYIHENTICFTKDCGR